MAHKLPHKLIAWRTGSRIAWRIAVSLLLLAAMTGMASAQGGYTLVRYSVESGAVSTGNGYTLVATTGQADAGTLSGGGFTLEGGFLTGASVPAQPVKQQLYMPALRR